MNDSSGTRCTSYPLEAEAQIQGQPELNKQTNKQQDQLRKATKEEEEEKEEGQTMKQRESIAS